MLRTINPCAASKTAEIMSRYRPIAPKPADENDNNSALPDGIRKSPYLRNIWANLQARPTRTRKRGRSAAFSPPPSVKRMARPCLQGLSPPYQMVAKNFTMHGLHVAAAVPEVPIYPSLVPFKCGLDTAASTDSVVVPPQFVCRGPPEISPKSLDLNLSAVNPPEELDFLAQLQEPAKYSPAAVISPKPIRPVGSTITVVNITDINTGKQKQITEDAEAALEAESAPAIISDSNNKVRLTNSAYKEMVGQPECVWLEYAGGRSRRIGGEVVVQFRDMKPQMEMHEFNCEVKIEWETEGTKKGVIAKCNGRKLTCKRKDYQFLWRIYYGQGE